MAYKALRSMRGIPQGRDAMRMMQRMGMETEEIKGVKEVIIKTEDKTIVIEEPNVVAMTMEQQTIFQVIGGNRRDEAPEEEKPEILDNDINLVAEQAKVSIDEAKSALEETGGDLAQAIILLKQKSKSK